MSGENCDERLEDTGKRQFYIDSILHRKKLEPPNTEIEGNTKLIKCNVIIVISTVFNLTFNEIVLLKYPYL